MVEYPWLVAIHNEHTGETEEASIVPLDGPLAKKKIDTSWWSVVANKEDADDSEWKRGMFE